MSDFQKKNVLDYSSNRISRIEKEVDYSSNRCASYMLKYLLIVK